MCVGCGEMQRRKHNDCFWEYKWMLTVKLTFVSNSDRTFVVEVCEFPLSWSLFLVVFLKGLFWVPSHSPCIYCL